MTALVELTNSDGNKSIYFLAPVGAGEKLALDGTTVRVLTPDSPLGEALMGNTLDDDVELKLPGRTMETVITGIA